jgi:hypothetical protein
MTKQKMPDGWIRVTWKDAQGKKWSDNMPISAFGHFELTLLSKGGVIVKEEF